MMAEKIDRKARKARVRELLADAQVSPKAMTALYLGLCLVLSLVDTLAGGGGVLPMFVSILTSLLALTLGSGFALYCMAVRRGERSEFLTLFDGFSFVGKIIGLNIVIFFFTFLWSMLFAVPGIVAAYRYRFALYNLYENPGIGALEALDMSKRQTRGYKAQLFTLDLSYLGWSVLASLPAIAYAALTYREVCRLTEQFLSGAVSALPDPSGIYILMPDWAWALVIGLWSLAAGLFYLAHFVCVELEYFETAKRTSGVGEGAEEAWSGGPDGLGGL